MATYQSNKIFSEKNQLRRDNYEWENYELISNSRMCEAPRNVGITAWKIPLFHIIHFFCVCP